MKSKQIVFLAQTAVMLALLIGVQFATRSFGQFVTGSLVNLILLVSALAIGVGGGLVVAVLSPFFAVLVGMGPAFLQIVPFMAVGNAILVLVAQFSRKPLAGKGMKNIFAAAAGLAAAAAAKFGFLWIGLVVVALPMIPGITENQVAAISTAFTWPQLVTALLGGMLAMTIVPLLNKALKK